MPPRFCRTRARRGCAKRVASSNGTSGAPCPPATMSAGRKFDTTGACTAAAISAGSPSCQVQANAAARIRFGDALVIDGLTVAAHEVKRVALRGGLRRIAVGFAEAPVETCKLGGGGAAGIHCGQNCFAKRGGIGKCAMANEFDCGRVRAREMRQSATSMPSAEVPLMIPATSMDFFCRRRTHAISCGVLAAMSSVKARTASRMAAMVFAFGAGKSCGMTQQLLAVRAHDCGGLLDDTAEAAGALGLGQDRFVGGEYERGVFADLDQVRAGGDGRDGCLFHRSVMQDAAHLHVVGDDESAEGDLCLSVRSIQKGEMDAGLAWYPAC